MTVVDIDHLRGWIGRSEEAREVLTPALANRFAATLETTGAQGYAPRLIHFCLTQPAVGMEGLGDDGHPAKGGFLPPVPLPRRMWAGGDITFHDDIRIGEEVLRRSEITDVTLKEGRSGALCFVTVAHEISSAGRLVLSERQDIVYRGETPPSGGGAVRPVTEAPVGKHRATVMPSTALLFRYSALTFNGHRIHYDRDYAMSEENYPGLVVHGPLQATLLCHFAERIAGKPLVGFRFRGLSPAFDGTALSLHAEEAEGGLKLWTAPDGGAVAMEAFASW